MIPRFKDERDVFFEKRFGMFVHWGLYSIPAWHEQILWRTDMTRKEYEKLIHQFNPTNFDPNKWLDILQEAGMQYICFTTKHHDGFCMWDTEFTDYNVMNSPYGKDILAMLAEACHKRDIPLSLYYSCPDWHHPSYPNQGRHHEMFGPRQGDVPDIDAYYKYVKNQVYELCTKYGKIYQFFWDVNVAEHIDPSINDMIRSLQPGILINDRGPGPGDYNTPERHIPDQKEFSSPTEACESLGSESWGYKSDEDYFSTKHIIQNIDQILAMGGNYLLNVGPTSDGTIVQKNIEDLRKIGEWYSSVNEAFVDTYPASFMIEEEDMFVTKKDNILFIHLFKEPKSNAILLRPLDYLPKKATLLNNQQELEASVSVTPSYFKEKPYLRIRGLPVNEMADTVMVIKIEFDQELND